MTRAQAGDASLPSASYTGRLPAGKEKPSEPAPWERKLISILTGKHGNVVPFARSHAEMSNGF